MGSAAPLGTPWPKAAPRALWNPWANDSSLCLDYSLCPLNRPAQTGLSIATKLNAAMEHKLKGFPKMEEPSERSGGALASPYLTRA